MPTDDQLPNHRKRLRHPLCQSKATEELYLKPQS